MDKQVSVSNDASEVKRQKTEPGLNYDTPFKVLMPSSQLRDLDLVKWLDNKLGDNNELWSGRQAASLLSREMLIELETCFQALEPHVKLKIVLSVPHLSYRLITMWKEPLINLLDLARRDADDWIETVADMYREYPNRQCIIPIPSNTDSYFCKSLDELRKMVRKHSTSNNLRLLPLDLSAVSQNAIKTRFGLTEIENRKHFNLKRRAKSYTLKAELLKSVEVGCNRNKNQKLDVVSSSFPIRMRSTVRKPNNDLPMRGIPNTNTCKLSAGFTNEPRKFQRQLTRREGGAKFIDIGDLPQALSVRRKEQEAEERARKQLEREEQKKRAQAEKAAKEAKRAAIAAQKSKETAAVVTAMDEIPNMVDEPIPSTIRNSDHETNHISINEGSHNTKQENGNLPSSYGDVREVPTVQSEQNQEPQSPSAAVHLSRRESFARRQCEEMLACANVLNEEGHRMVIAFMSGNKIHPYPHLGDLLTLKLSETYEDELRPDGAVQKMRVETFFQMDYRTGEWKRLRKTRALRPEEIRTLQQTIV
uniref:HDAg domain-containing protein n=1 Tax=Setaria digitata TaxID=48799 RepID=A0A915PNL9_9BILA